MKLNLKNVIFGVLFFSGVTIFASCNSEKVTFFDSGHCEITIKKNPKRIYCDEVFFEFLMRADLKGTTIFSSKKVINNPWTRLIYPEISDENIINFDNTINSLKPYKLDLVILQDDDVVQNFRERGMKNVVYLYPCDTAYFLETNNELRNLVNEVWSNKDTEFINKIASYGTSKKFETASTKLKENGITQLKVLKLDDEGNSSINQGFDPFNKKPFNFFTVAKDNRPYFDYTMGILDFSYSTMKFTREEKPSIASIKTLNPDIIICNAKYQNTAKEWLMTNAPEITAITNNKFYSVPTAIGSAEKSCLSWDNYYTGLINTIFPGTIPEENNSLNSYEDYMRYTLASIYGDATFTEEQISNYINGLTPTGETYQ